MSSLDTEFHRRLSKWLRETEDRTLGQMRGGALDYEAYKSQSGFLRAIDQVKAQCQQIETDISEGK